METCNVNLAGCFDFCFLLKILKILKFETIFAWFDVYSSQVNSTQLKWEIVSNFVAFLENLNFTESYLEIVDSKAMK